MSNLALDHADRHEPGDAACESGTLDDLDYPFDVLVGERRLLGEPLVRGAADDDPLLLELAAQLSAADPLACARPRHGPPGAVAGRAEGALHRARLAGEDEAGRAHAAGNEDRLANCAEVGGDLRRSGRLR